MYVLWIVVGTLMAIYVAVQLLRYRGSDKWPTAVATLEGIQVRRSQDDGHHYFPFVTFSFLADGNRYSGEWSGPAFGHEQEVKDFLRENMPIGAEFTARYKPRQPSLNLLDVNSEILNQNRPTRLNL
jgi:hypothetical protein